MVGPGTSAREAYARQRARDAKDRGRRWARKVGAAAVAGGAIGGAVLVVVWLADRVLLSVSGPPLPGAFSREVAVALGLAAAVWVSTGLLRAGRDRRAWADGAAGEERVGAALAALEPAGWWVLHDRRIPGSAANIDHIAVGPGGVWVIETKSWTGVVEVGASALRHNGRPADDVYDQVWREAAAVTNLVRTAITPPLEGARARPTICVDRGRLTIGRDAAGRPIRGPVEFHTHESLVRRLQSAAPVLSVEQVAAITTALDRGLRPASERGRPDAHARAP